MYCPACGAELPDPASFCNQCGAPIPKMETDAAQSAPTATQPSTSTSAHVTTPSAQAPMPAPAPAQPPASPGTEAQPRPAKRKGPIIGIIAAVAALAIAAVVLLVVLPNLGPKSALVTFAMQYEGFQGGSSPIPVRVEGTDTKGNAISGLFGVDPTTMMLELPEGTFTIAPAGNVVNPDGSILRTTRREAVDVASRRRANPPTGATPPWSTARRSQSPSHTSM